ncbi:MAG: phytoene desaturase [Planctomycetes bacterium]|nr:phytoene desaturase [Planctomycetota bacterium]
MSVRVAIIGGGLGGIATAVRLASQDYRVTLCEASATLGGKMNSWESRGYRFDTGPSLITMPDVFRETFAAAGERLEDHIELQRLDPVADYVWPDGTAFRHTTNLPSWLDTIRAIEPRDVDGFLRFLQLGARIFEVSDATFLRRPMSAPPDKRVFKALRHFPFRHAWGNYARMVDAHFRSPYLRQMFHRYPTYVGSSPYRSPATLAVIPYLEFAFGGWFVSGGLYRIVQALAGIARAKGVEVLLSAEVEHIGQDSGRVKSIRLADGRNIEADVVVMNGDAGLLGQLLAEPAPRALPAEERSMSGFVTLLGTGTDMPHLGHHTVYFSADYRREFDQLHAGAFPSDPTVYVNAPSRSDRSLVPGRGEALFLMANAPALSAPWDQGTTRAAFERVIARLDRSGLPDLRPDIVVRDHWTPRRIGTTYRMPGGAIYGQNSHGWRNAFLRPANRQKLRGLYLVGGSSHPGGGTPTVLLSAKITTELIGKHERA